MRAERAVLDTNVLISAAIAPSGKPRRVLMHFGRHGTLLICREAMTELAARLAKSKFDRYLSEDARRAFLDALFAVAEIVPIPGALHVCRDPDDDKILECAIEGGADCLVTGDNDLLALRPCGESGRASRIEDALYDRVAILRPSELVVLAGLT